MIKTIKEIKTKNGIKTHFYNEYNILVATEENGELIIYTSDLTNKERRKIQQMI